MASLDADRRRREALERRERAVAAREAELAGRRPWRALIWRARLAPLRIVELVVGSWLVVSAIVAGSGLVAVSAVLCGLVLVAAAVMQLTA
jgi:hypothetical protein